MTNFNVLEKFAVSALLAEGVGFEPTLNGFRDRRAAVTLTLNM